MLDAWLDEAGSAPWAVRDKESVRAGCDGHRIGLRSECSSALAPCGAFCGNIRSSLTLCSPLVCVGAPVVPGIDPLTAAVGDVVFVDEISLPVILKAAMCGGGKGVRVAKERDELEALFNSAPSEALVVFGDGTVFTERTRGACAADAAGGACGAGAVRSACAAGAA
jgi:hypothetical protein